MTEIKSEVKATTASIVSDHKIDAKSDPILSKIDASGEVTLDDLNLVKYYKSLLDGGRTLNDAIYDTHEYKKLQKLHEEWIRSNRVE